MLKLPGDVIILPEKGKRWVIMNVFSRTSLGVESDAMQLYRDSESMSAGELASSYEGVSFNVWDIWEFTNYECAIDDPTRYIRDVERWPEPNSVDASELVELLKKNYLLLEDEESYLARFARKNGEVDYEHFGNFRDQLAQQIALHSPEPHNYWLDQKFTKDRQEIKNTLYKAIQENFLSEYFKKKIKKGDVFLDIGCGTGFYANMASRLGATAIGIDPNLQHIEIAISTAEKGARFEQKPLGSSGALDSIESNSVDYVFMSDALLMYFVPEEAFPADVEILFNDIHRILKKDGEFICCEPHHVFLYMPWLGSKERPFTIVTEYMEKTAGISPTMSWHVQACAKGKFAVTWLEELRPSADYKEKDARAYYFTSQFPLWMLYEMKPL